MFSVTTLVDVGYKNLTENIEKIDYINTKHILLATLSNAAQPQSKPLLMKFAAPNFGHASWRHGALSGLQHYHDEEVSEEFLAFRLCVTGKLVDQFGPSTV